MHEGIPSCKNTPVPLTSKPTLELPLQLPTHRTAGLLRRRNSTILNFLCRTLPKHNGPTGQCTPKLQNPIAPFDPNTRGNRLCKVTRLLSYVKGLLEPQLRLWVTASRLNVPRPVPLVIVPPKQLCSTRQWPLFLKRNGWTWVEQTLGETHRPELVCNATQRQLGTKSLRPTQLNPNLKLLQQWLEGMSDPR